MRNPLTSPAEAYAPDADRAGPTGELPQWLVHFLAMLIHFLLKNMLAMGLRHPARGRHGGRTGRTCQRARRRPRLRRSAANSVTPSPGCASATASGRGIGTGRSCPAPSWRLAAAWREVPCQRSAARAALVGKPRRRARHGSFHQQRRRRGNRSAAATAGCCECSAAGAERHASRSGACKIARVRVGRNPAAGFRACRPQSVDRAATLPGTAKPVLSDARGRSTAGPAVLICAV